METRGTKEQMADWVSHDGTKRVSATVTRYDLDFGGAVVRRLWPLVLAQYIPAEGQGQTLIDALADEPVGRQHIIIRALGTITLHNQPSETAKPAEGLSDVQ